MEAGNDSDTHYMQDEVLIAGFGRRGHAVGDIPGVRFKVSQNADLPFLQSSCSICWHATVGGGHTWNIPPYIKKFASQTL